MTTLLVIAALVVAVVAAARSTWSPCGVSMLATITPLAERGRGHRYRTTVLWFVAGAVVGGATLGLAGAGLALAVRALEPGPLAQGALAGAAALVAAASDTPLVSFSLPVHHRQVNERWLDGFRPWVYGAGFGWQIGVGLATYIKTAAVYLMLVLAVATGDVRVALVVGIVFGLVRGLAVLLGRGITDADSLARFHRRFTRWEPRSLAVVVGVEVATALLFALALAPWTVVLVVLPAAALVARHLRVRRPNASAPARGGDLTASPAAGAAAAPVAGPR